MSIDLLLQHVQTDLVAVAAADIVSWAFNILILLALAGVVVALATDDRDPSTVLAWLFVIMLLPVIGIIAYFFIGRNYRRASRKRVEVLGQMTRLADRSLGPALAANQAFSEAALTALKDTPGGRVESTGRHENGIVPLPADTVDIYTAGSQKFPALLAEMATAEKYIHLMYLIWEQDELTAKVKTVLLDRLQGRRAGPHPLRLAQLHQLQEGRAQGARRSGRRGGPVLQAPLARQLPQPHEDGDHRRQERVLGRHEHGPGVHRRRPAVRGVARHVVPAQRARGDALPHAVRVHLAAQRAQRGPGDGLPRRAAGARARRGHAGAGAALERLDRVQDHPRRVHHRAHQRARAHLDPVAVLRARRAADHGDVRGGAGRRGRALHDDRRAGQEDPVLRGPRLLPATAAGRREGLPLHSRVPARQDGDGGRAVLAHRHLQLGHPQLHPARRGGVDLLRRRRRHGTTRRSTRRTSRTAAR